MPATLAMPAPLAIPTCPADCAAPSGNLLDQTALVHCQGMVLSSNAAWRAADAGAMGQCGWPAAVAVGQNLLRCWQRAAMRAVPGAREACEALDAVLAGRSPCRTLSLRWPGQAPGAVQITITSLGALSARVVIVPASTCWAPPVHTKETVHAR